MNWWSRSSSSVGGESRSIYSGHLLTGGGGQEPPVNGAAQPYGRPVMPGPTPNPLQEILDSLNAQESATTDAQDRSALPSRSDLLSAMAERLAEIVPDLQYKYPGFEAISLPDLEETLDSLKYSQELFGAVKSDLAVGDLNFPRTRLALYQRFAEKWGPEAATALVQAATEGAPVARVISTLLGPDFVEAAIADIPMLSREVAKELGITVEDGRLRVRPGVYDPRDDPKSLWVEKNKEYSRKAVPFFRSIIEGFKRLAESLFG